MTTPEQTPHAATTTGGTDEREVPAQERAARAAAQEQEEVTGHMMKQEWVDQVANEADLSKIDPDRAVRG